MNNRTPSEQGFTLIEILVVVAILGVLMGLVTLLIPKAHQESAKFQTTTRITELDTAVERYLADPALRRLPPMALDALAKASKYYEGMAFAQPNGVNECCEVLFIALRHPDLSARFDAARLPGENPVGNTDEDFFNKAPPGANDTDAREILDAWGNPIAYIDKNHYDKPVKLRLADGSEVEVIAVRKPDGTYYNADRFQLISLGPNQAQDDATGDLAKYDDICNFTVTGK
ncbi:MAG: type II secretion system protein [Planctomycetaceae bacterium]